ncbi:RNA-directed DNA polymerase, eukaryota, reverse transcriptase zinc-binding domain protein [Tanacetum coccineum]
MVDKSLPFFKTLKWCIKKTDFTWTEEAKKALGEMKRQMAELPTLTVLQIPVYFVGRALQSPEINYPPMEKLIRSLVHGEKRLRRTSNRGQVLADFLVELRTKRVNLVEEPMKVPAEVAIKMWSFFTYALSNEGLSGANLILTNLEGSCIMHPGPRSVVTKAMQLGYYWPTMHIDARMSAFIPGRQITDNILLIKELLRVLIMFKFPDKMIRWIMVCVKTVAFIINVNGVKLVILKNISEDVKFKYHWGCKDLQILHLCFADDLLVLCHGDLNSVKVVKSALDIFNYVSGLNLNIGKSIMFFGNVKEQDKQEILSILPFKIGSCQVGDGSKIFLWHDKWWGHEPLIKSIPMETIRQAGLESNVKLKDMIKNGLWKWPMEWNSTFRYNLPNFVPKLIEGLKDSYLWETNDGKCNNFSTNRAWKDRLTTQERIMKWYLEKQLKCSLCGMKPNSLNHLFFECNYSNMVWKELMEKSDHYAMPNRWDDLLITMKNIRNNKSIKSVLRRIVLVACVYFIWNERNKRLFTNDKKNNNELIAEVVNHIKLKLACLTVKRTYQTVDICKK